MDPATRQTRAIEAVVAVAAQIGLEPVRPVVLRDSNHTSIHLQPYPLVARVSSRAIDHMTAASLTRELAVAKHLAAAGAPIVLPTTDPPPGPHLSGDVGLTLWQFVDHRPALDSEGGQALGALLAVHGALASYADALPPFTDAIDGCRSLLGDEQSLSMAHADRVFLIAAHDRLRERLRALSFVPVPLHGDPHLGNALVTSQGMTWTDFESACLGPPEWDLSCLPETSLSGINTNRELHAVLRDLRSLCVAVWCSAGADGSREKHAAAHYHLQRLRSAHNPLNQL